jgi:hypothetical protein
MAAARRRCAYHGHRKATHRVKGRSRWGWVCDECAGRYRRAGRPTVHFASPQLRLFDDAA